MTYLWRSAADRLGAILGTQPRDSDHHKAPTFFVSEKVDYAIIALLIALASAINLNWIWQDQSPMPYGDSYVYLSKLLTFLDRFDPESPENLGALLSNLSFNGRPPLYQLLTAPFIFLFGRSEDAALLINIPFLAILLVSTYNIGRLTGNGRAGLLAAFLVTSYPPIAQLSRAYILHFATAACGALSLWLLLLLMNTRSAKVAWLFGMSLGFGLLIHPRFLKLLALPTIIFGLYMLLFQTHPKHPKSIKDTPKWIVNKIRDPLVARGLMPGALITLILALPWYLTSGLQLYERLQKLSTPELAEFRGITHFTVGFPETKASFWWYAQTAPGALSNVLSVFILAGLVLAIIKRSLLTGFLAVTLACAYLMLSSGPSLAWWNFNCASAAAALTALWISELRPKWLSNSLTIVCIAVAAFNFSTVTWGITPWSKPVAIALGSPLLDRATCVSARTAALCPSPAEVVRWPVEDILMTLLDSPECKRKQPCLLMMIPRWKGLDRPYFSFHVAKSRLQKNIRVTHPRTKELAYPYNLAGLLQADYLLYPDIQYPRSSTSYYAASVRFLQAPPIEFTMTHQLVASFEMPNGRFARLIKRIKPLTVEEAEASIAALELPDIYLSERFAVLGRLYAEHDDPERALAFHEEILLSSSDIQMKTRARRRLIHMYRQPGRIERAAAFYQEVLKRNPEDFTTRVQFAEILVEAGKPGDAIGELGKAIELTPDDYQPRHVLADAYRLLGETDRAIALYQETLESNPKHLASRIRLAKLYNKVGKHDVAIAELEIAVASSPQSFWARRTLADTHRLLGETDEAIAVYQEFLRIDPDHIRARNALAQLGAKSRKSE